MANVCVQTASNPFDIIQPVLQYPGTRPGKWGVRSWYVTIHSGALMSTELPVAAGDAIVCNMTRTGEFAWFIGSTVRSSGLQTNQRVDVAHKGAAARLRQQPWAYTTTECYGCRGCSTFPTEPLHFTDMSLRSAGKGPSAVLGCCLSVCLSVCVHGYGCVRGELTDDQLSLVRAGSRPCNSGLDGECQTSQEG
eukprot:COSAG01_NODE_5198_length_4416_cov_9.375029_2_plen_193_part_00